MRFLVLCGLLVLSGHAVKASGADTTGLRSACAQLRTALLSADTAALNGLLHPQLSYGHSNGWVEDKAAVKADLHNGKLRYLEIAESDWRLTGGEKGVASLRCNLKVKVSLDGSSLDFTLHVLQVWVKKDGRWQLLARQSGKM